MKHLLSVTIGPCKRGGAAVGAMGSEADCRFIRDAGVSPSVTPFRARDASAGEGGREPYVRSMRFVCWWFH